MPQPIISVGQAIVVIERRTNQEYSMLVSHNCTVWHFKDGVVTVVITGPDKKLLYAQVMWDEIGECWLIISALVPSLMVSPKWGPDGKVFNGKGTTLGHKRKPKGVINER